MLLVLNNNLNQFKLFKIKELLIFRKKALLITVDNGE